MSGVHLCFCSFLSFSHHMVSLSCFHCFIPQLAPCFSFVFQFVHKLVLFLTGKYNFLFPLFTRSIYCSLFFAGLFCLCSWVYMCIFHYFNYYLPDLSLSFVWGSSLVSHFWVFVFISFNAITNHLWNLLSWPGIKPWAFGVVALTPRPWTTRELTLGSIKYWELTQKKPLEYKTWHHPTTSSTLCRMPYLNNKQSKNTNPIISKQDYHLSQPCPSEGKQVNKQTNKNSTNLTLYEAYTNHWTNLRRKETKRKKEFNLKPGKKQTSKTMLKK